MLIFHSFALSFDKIGCTREYKTKNLCFYFDIPLVCTIF